MYRKIAFLTSRFSLTLILLLGSVYLAASQTDLEYQTRGNRREGIKPKPVGGYDIELISALVDHQDAYNPRTNRLGVKFYLHRPSNVYLTVRELDYKHYYWLDEVKPVKPWSVGFDNVFEWSTNDVIRHLDGLGIEDLGALVRLDKAKPAIVEKVAPVVLYSTKVPDRIRGYLFTLRANGDMRTTCSVYKEGDANMLFKRHIRRQRAGRPFTVRWDSTGRPAGLYRLQVSGFFLDTSDRVDQVVSFYHQPNVN